MLNRLIWKISFLFTVLLIIITGSCGLPQFAVLTTPTFTGSKTDLSSVSFEMIPDPEVEGYEIYYIIVEEESTIIDSKGLIDQFDPKLYPDTDFPIKTGNGSLSSNDHFYRIYRYNSSASIQPLIDHTSSGDSVQINFTGAPNYNVELVINGSTQPWEIGRSVLFSDQLSSGYYPLDAASINDPIENMHRRFYEQYHSDDRDLSHLDSLNIAPAGQIVYIAFFCYSYLNSFSSLGFESSYPAYIGHIELHLNNGELK